MSERTRVLIVDDAGDYARMMAAAIRTAEAAGLPEIDVAESYRAAFNALTTSDYNAAVIDYWLDERTGLDLLQAIRARGVDTPVIVLTGRGDEAIAIEALRCGAVDYFSKASVTPEALVRSLRHAAVVQQQDRDRRSMEAALRVSDERSRALLENSSDAIVVADANGCVLYSTVSAERHLGWSSGEVRGRPMIEYIHEEDAAAARERFAAALASPGVRIELAFRLRHADGSWRSVEAVAVNRLEDPSVGGIVINARDVTGRRRLEEQLRVAQKMEAIGQLAGGIAHDFNNLLTSVLGYCSLILDELPEDSPIRHDVEEIRTAGERAASLTRQLLAFSRRQMLRPRTVELTQLVGDLEPMLRRLIGEDIELAITLATDVAPVTLDPGLVEQVLMNLVVNARDAMPLGGRLAIETQAIDLDRPMADRAFSMPAGRYAMLAVGDTGHGMDAATRARVFEPFFTTKEQGKGTGLGLATVYGMVKQSGGFIWVESEPSRGTVFKLYFPCTDVAAPATEEAAAVRPSAPRGTETVLLVEDEDAVRAFAMAVLRRQGYTVLEARHGLDALSIVERHANPIHLMITDMVMPHLSGGDLARQVRALRPETRVMFVSGYSDHAAVQRDLTPEAAFLQKPFTPDSFARKVRVVLDAVPPRL